MTADAKPDEKGASMADEQAEPTTSRGQDPSSATPPKRAASASRTGATAPTVPAPRRGAELSTERGVTRIADSVVAKIAALATREIPGVQSMGKGLARAFGAIRSRVPGTSTETSTQGIGVEVGERQAAIDIDIVAYYGLSIVETADAVRANVIDRIESMTGLEVVEVNISVDDLYLGDEEEARVE